MVPRLFSFFVANLVPLPIEVADQLPRVAILVSELLPSHLDLGFHLPRG